MKKLFALFTLLLAFGIMSSFAQDYTITTAGSNLIITDNSGNGETITVSESGSNIRFVVTPTTRTYSINGGPVTAFTTPADVALAGSSSITINAATGNDIIDIGAFAAALPNLTVNGGTGDDAINFNGNITFAANANLDVDLQNDDVTPGTDVINLTGGADLILSGTGAADMKASKNMVFAANTVLRTVNGNLTLEANQQATPTSGSNFAGIDASAATVLIESTGTGSVTVKGKGGTTSLSNYGVFIAAGSILRGGTTNTITVNGTGGASTGNNNYGVCVDGASSTITSAGGNVSITGMGGGSGTSSNNNGIYVLAAGTITATGTATVTVNGTGGISSGTSNNGVYVNQTNSTITSGGGNVIVTGQGGGSGASSDNYGIFVSTAAKITAAGSGTVVVNGTGGSATGASNRGVVVFNTGATITSAGGNVSITGIGGGSVTSSINYGVYVVSGGTITAGSSGTVTVNGTGGTSTGNTNYGVYVNGTSSTITSAGGNVNVAGLGGGSGTSNSNYGIFVQSDGKITAAGTGTVTVNGTGGPPTGINNFGVRVAGANAAITSGGGYVNVTGLGGGSGTSNGNLGIHVYLAGSITAGGTGTVTVNGTGGPSTGLNNYGVQVYGTNSVITSAGGNVSVTGMGGGSLSSSDNYGVLVNTAGNITAGGTGTVNVNGTGGNTTGATNIGVMVSGTSSAITSTAGNVSVTGNGGGSGASGNNYGIYVALEGKITAGSTGTVTANGTGGSASGAVNTGVYLFGSSALITSAGGNVSVTGQGGGSGSSTNNYGVNIQNGGLISVTGSGTLGVTGTGGPSSGTGNDGVYLVNSGAVAISSPSGAITVTGTRGSSSASSADVNLFNGYVGSTSTTAGITINSTTGGTWTNNANTDVSTNAAQSTTFGAGSKFNVEIDGITLNSNYQQLNAVGLLNLNNATLTFTGSSLVPSLGQTFTIVNNDGSDAITGTFNGLAEGAAITGFLGSALNANITYVGGTGNDVVLTVVAGPITWDGSSSTNWNTAANWSTNTVPIATSNVIIPNVANDPVISGASTINNVDLAAGATLTVAGSGTLTLNGALANAGAVTIQSGGNFLQGNSSSYSGAGTFKVERQITSAANGYRDISSPVSTTVADLADDFPVFGSDAVKCWYAYSPYPNVQTYNEALSLVGGSYYEGWESRTGTGNALIPMQGVAIRTYAGAPFTLDFTGTPNNGPKDIAITHTTSATPSQDGWNFVGNPYPSNIDWVTVAAMNPAITGSYYVFNTTGEYTGAWGTCNAAGACAGTIPLTQYIASGQGFFVKKTTAGSGLFVTNNTVRTGTAANFFKTDELSNEVRLSLSDGINTDEILAYTDINATNTEDQGLDAQKMAAGSTVYISFRMPDNEYAINVINEMNEQTELPLVLWVTDDGTYTVDATVLNTPGLTAYLKDVQTNTLYDLSTTAPVLTLTGNQVYTGRFSIVFKAAVVSNITNNTETVARIYSSGNAVFVERASAAPASISISNILGQQISETTTNTELTTLKLSGTEAWYAIVKVKEGSKVTVAKVFISNK